MAVINSGTTSSIDEIARVDSSNEARLKLEMIRLYEGTFEDDDNGGSRVSVSTKAEMELMIHSIYKETIYPMICADINRKHQNFLFMIREMFGLDLSMGMPWNLHKAETNLGSQSFQLKFLNGISKPVSTGKSIEGNEQRPFLVALVDGMSGQIVTTGAEAAMEVEIVVLEGDSNDDEADNWTSDEFNDKIIGEWNGKKVLQGNTFMNLNEGIVSVDKISFTHNSVWKGKRKCRIGARSVNGVLPTRVKEAKTESFLVRDKRKLLYKKHEIPSSSDNLYRLYKISRRGDCFNRLSKAHINTVMDLLTLHAINPQRLKDILDVRPNVWKIIMDHAKMCRDDKGIYLYQSPRDGQKSNGVAFNISGQLVGTIAGSHFVPCDKLPNNERVDAQKLIVSSSEHWEEVVPFNNQDLLINHLQSRTTLNHPSSYNNLKVVIPQTTDPHCQTSLTSPKSQMSPQSRTTLNHPSSCNNLKVVIPQTTDPHCQTSLTSPKSQSQSPKRPASSEHTISNSPKQPRYNHPKLSPSTPSVGTDTSMRRKANNLELTPDDDDDDDDYLKYLNLRDRWKIVWCAVGWISVILKLRKSRTASCHHDTFIVIAGLQPH